ncbi:hypothetical protein Ciccas_006033 [Cichlidogyrus casuarinus]|uniref:Uncharacterized protein n=1 Tax=Cichlidogyrus casuarinus TaxID=1844966 RepID=A0ABD2QAQ7_9PLAT
MKENQYGKTMEKLKGTGRLWEDPDFPADSRAFGKVRLDKDIEWKRPKQIFGDAEFIKDNVNRFDVNQGQLGDCWLLAVISSIATYETLFNQLCPPGQYIQSPDYVGMFRFRFWSFGQWKEVLVDDRLPVIAGTNQMVFMHSPTNGEMWSSLMEKAYAKLLGNYGNLVGGMQSEAMEDLTGKQLKVDRVNQTSTDVKEGRLGNGLVTSHAYSVTKIDQVRFRGNTQWLVRCRNPWGNSVEWNGPFSDRSPEWNEIDENDKSRLGITFSKDGEFWMRYEDFIENFTTLEVCYLGLEALDENDRFAGKRRMEETLFAEDTQVIKKFEQLCDAHKDLHPEGLRKILNESSMMKTPGFSDFNKELCRSLIAAVDDDQSGVLELEEFKTLWDNMEAWRFIFLKFDIDKNGSFTSNEFREALEKTDHKTGNISFEDWILCCSRLKNATENLKAQPKNLDGEALLDTDDVSLHFSISLFKLSSCDSAFTSSTDDADQQINIPSLTIKMFLFNLFDIFK